MKDFFKGRVFKALLCVFAVIVGIMIYQAASGAYASLPEAIVGTIVTPIVKISSGISNGVGGFFNSLAVLRVCLFTDLLFFHVVALAGLAVFFALAQIFTQKINGVAQCFKCHT